MERNDIHILKGEHRPGGNERMRRLLGVVRAARIDLRALVTHRFALDDIAAAYDVFAHQRDGVFKVAITP
jgi:alcohol dehydrogenase